jgi:hypothetical protein
MQSFRCSTLALIAALLLGGCASSSHHPSPTLPRTAQWGLVPMINYSQTPQAGERSEQILLSVLSKDGLHPRLYTPSAATDPALLDDNERQAGALQWARTQKLDYVITGSVEEWRYKNGLDAEPAVGVSLRVLDAASGRLLWSISGARAGWASDTLAGTTQQVLDQLVSELRLE